MSEKILLIDGHSILNRAFLWSAGSYKFRRKTHRGSIWFPEYPFSDNRRREASVSDSGI